MKTIWIKHKKLWMRLAMAILLLPVAIGIVAAMRVDTERDNPVSFGKFVPPRQASKWSFYQTPFYFPFKTRGTYLQAIQPFTQDIGYLSRRNSSGFRTPEYTIAHPPNTFRVVILGDNFTTAPVLPIEQTYPYELSKLMNSQCDQCQSEVIALAANPYRLTDYFITFLAHGQRLKPDLVIFQISPGDLDFLDYLSILDFQKVPKIYDRYGQKEREVMTPGSMDWKVFVEVLENLSTWSKSNGVPIMFLAFAPIDSSRNGHNFDHYNLSRLPGVQPFQAVVNEIRAHGFVVHYLFDTFRNLAGDHYLAISPTVGDPNEYCHRLVATSLLETLNQNGLFPCSEGMKLKPEDPMWKQESVLRKDAADHWVDFNTSFTRQLHLFEKLKALHPKDPWVTVELAEVYVGMTRPKDSLLTYESLLEMAPEISAPYFHLAIRTFGADREKYLLKMIQAVPDHTPSLAALAALYQETSRVEDACKMYKRVMEVPQYLEQYKYATTRYSELKCDQRSASTAASSKRH